ncbi:MAG: class I SAM-dependent methyltransferase, partial [Candidatus Acidiferrales bacterium]
PRAMTTHDSRTESHKQSNEESQANPQEAQQKQMDLVRDRFTRTASVFADFALVDRTAEAEHLLELIAPSGNERALDVACGPGTLARIFAPRVRWIGGLDLTPAMLERARKDAAATHIENFRPLRGNALGMPFHAATFDIVITSYSIHHLPDAVAAIREIARILKPGGKFGLLDMVVSEEPSRAAACNHIEWVRDPSHTRALTITEFERLLTSSGFNVVARDTEDHPRSLDKWMHTAGWKRGDAVYENVRRLLETSIPGDTAGLRPRFLVSSSPKEAVAATDGRPDMELLHTAAFIVAQKQ